MKKSIEKLISEKDSEILTEANKCSIQESLLDTLSSQSTDDYFQIVAAYIRARKTKGLTTIQVAETSGIPEITVHRFENLQNIPKVTTLIKILQAVDIKLIANNI